jgi:hypothetical protein
VDLGKGFGGLDAMRFWFTSVSVFYIIASHWERVQLSELNSSQLLSSKPGNTRETPVFDCEKLVETRSGCLVSNPLGSSTECNGVIRLLSIQDLTNYCFPIS